MFCNSFSIIVATEIKPQKNFESSKLVVLARLFEVIILNKSMQDRLADLRPYFYSIFLTATLTVLTMLLFCGDGSIL